VATFLTVWEFCHEYRVSRRTVYNWVRKGRLKVLRDARGRIFRVIDPQWPVLDQSNHPDLVMRLGCLKPGAVAALIGVHPATVRKMVYRGRLKPLWVGSQRRFSLAEVQRLIAERTLGHPPKSRREVDEGIVQWARWKLGLPVQESNDPMLQP